MTIDGALPSVSIATIEFRAEGGGTRLVVTEQGALLDGKADSSRDRGTASLLDALQASLAVG